MYSFTRSRLRVKIPGAGATLKQAGSKTLYLFKIKNDLIRNRNTCLEF